MGECNMGGHKTGEPHQRKNRRTIRLRGYDYSQAGAYFVTICTQNRECFFGDIVDGAMRLNDAGEMVEKWYRELENKFPDIRCDQYIVMPNHFHGVIVNVGADLRVCPGNAPDVHKSGEHKMGEHIGSPLRAVVQWFKTMTTNEYIRGVKQHGWQRFDRKLWQRNYYEHIVRNENELNRIREYIVNNPTQWPSDRLYTPVGADLCVCPPSVHELAVDYTTEAWMT
jgi:REP element-mobilizing transposase RayT